MQLRCLFAALTCCIALQESHKAFAQKSGRKSTSPPPARRPTRSTGGKAPLGPISVANIKFTLDAKSEACPLLILASDGLKLTGKADSELCGEAPLSWIGKRFALTQRRHNLVIWKSELQETYRKCNGKTALVQWNNESLEREQSHILLDFEDGQVTLSLNLKKQGPKTTLNSAGVSSSGHPNWCWSQQDTPMAQKRRHIEYLAQ